LLLGRVVDAGSGRPLPGAIVTLLGAGPASPRAITNGSGQFVFRRLPKGRFTLLATRPGYVDSAYGRRRPGGSTSSIQLDDGQRVGDLVIAMWRRAAVSGTVMDEAGEPLIGLTVRLFERRFTGGHRRFLPSGTATTDDRGMYRFSTLAPGDYIVAFVAHEASLPPDVSELMRTPSSPTDTRRQEIMRERFSVTMMAGQEIQVGSTVRQIDASAVPPISDDAAAPVFVYPTVFFPNSPTAARAAVITLESGQERDGVDLSLHPVRASRVSGAVVGPDGPAGNISVHLLPGTTDDVSELETAATMTDANGIFMLTGVVAGQYEIKVARIPRPAPAPGNMITTTVQIGGIMSMGMSSPLDGPGPAPVPPIPDDPALYADTPISVGESNVDNVLVTLQRGASVSGHVEFDGAADRPDASALSRVSIMLERADSRTAPMPGIGGLQSAPAGRIDETGAFKTYTQPTGRYLIRIGAPTGWTVKSVIAEGHDLSETPFDLGASDLKNVVVTFTDRPTKLTGLAHTKDGSADPDALVVVFPTDPAGWTDFGLAPRRLRSARPLKNGMYTITGLPAGDYYVAAISEDAISSWENPDVLAELSRLATHVSLADGDTHTQDLVRSGSDR
jgi:hypothetical protein